MEVDATIAVVVVMERCGRSGDGGLFALNAHRLGCDVRIRNA